jgi:hypothetical protein
MAELQGSSNSARALLPKLLKADLHGSILTGRCQTCDKHLMGLLIT